MVKHSTLIGIGLLLVLLCGGVVVVMFFAKKDSEVIAVISGIDSRSKYVSSVEQNDVFGDIHGSRDASSSEKKTLYVFDLTNAYWNSQINNWASNMNSNQGYDLVMFVVTLQGIVNREEPNLLVYGYFSSSWINNIDKYWFDVFNQPGQWLQDYELKEISTVQELVAIFRPYIQGLVVWDPDVDATANVATSLAGVLDSPIVMCEESRYADTGERSLYDLLISELHLPISINLAGMFTGTGTIPGTDISSTGSKKVDAYKWMKIHYLDTGKFNPKVIGYYEDGYARRPGTNILNWEALRDYIVAKKGFVVDLSVWGTETPNDDPGQPLGLDLKMLKEILTEARRQAGDEPIFALGFVPWNDKYTTEVGGARSPVDSEWEMVKIFSPYNIYTSPDVVNQGFTGNLSIHSHASFPERVWQNARPQPKPLENKTYITFYVGDYCDVGGIYHLLPESWDAKARGNIPLGWAITPMHIELIPDIMSYLYRTRSSQDYFTAGPTGIGYNMTAYLSGDGNPSPLDLSKRLSRYYFGRLNYSITSFYIDWIPPTSQVKEFHRVVSSDGFSSNQDPGQILYKDSLPMLRMIDLTGPGGGSLDAAVTRVYQSTFGLPKVGRQPNFLHFRTIYTSPDFLEKLVTRIKEERPKFNYEVVDPYTFFYLLRQHLGGNNNFKASYMVDGLQDQLEKNKEYSVSVLVRNDGWDTWTPVQGDTGVYELRVAWVKSDEWKPDNSLDDTEYERAGLPGAIEPGQIFQVDMSITTPQEPGLYMAVVDMVNNHKGWFRQIGCNLPFEKEIEIL